MFDEENLISPATFLSFCPSTWGRESPDAMSLRHPDTSLPYLLGRSSLHHAGRASAVQNSFLIILSFNIIKIFSFFSTMFFLKINAVNWIFMTCILCWLIKWFIRCLQKNILFAVGGYWKIHSWIELWLFCFNLWLKHTFLGIFLDSD